MRNGRHGLVVACYLAVHGSADVSKQCPLVCTPPFVLAKPMCMQKFVADEMLSSSQKVIPMTDLQA